MRGRRYQGEMEGIDSGSPLKACGEDGTEGKGKE